MQNHIYDNTLQYAEDLDFVISPVGSAWKTVLDDCGYPLHYLHLSDWNHPSLRGSYLMACTIFTTLFLESTNGIGDATQLPVEELVHFQTVATRTVLNDLALWKIPAPSTEVPDVTGWSGFRLRQSCPNPFNPTTVIAFDAPCEAAVRLSIHDVSGRLVDLLLDDRIVPQGRNEVVWQGRDSRGRQVPSGTYFYRLEAGPYQETKCMTLLK